MSVNGHPDVKGRPQPSAHARSPEPPHLPKVPFGIAGPDGKTYAGTKPLLDACGPKALAAWMRAEQRVLITDTTMRDAHQSLLATRFRTFDLTAIADDYTASLPGLFSIECWGGATFDVSMRFLNEDPWERLATLRAKLPNVLLQMLLRGANGVGYTNYPDNVVRYFIARSAKAGMDVFRIFDCLNWVENMRVAIDAVCEESRIAEGAICYTGNILDPDRAKYSLAYYVDLAKQLEAAGCHILAIKDMAGLLRPNAARKLVSTLRQEIGLPIHLHTHDTSGISAATVLTAILSGADAIDASMDAMSGMTSQPCLGSLVEALRLTQRDTVLDPDAIRRISFYWEAVRAQYAAFEADLRSGASEVYLHEMPGGQFTNLKEQARSLGLEPRWHEVASAYRAANDLFGDIIKVTPSSKVVGDMALMMVSQNLSPADVLDPARDVAFPGSVIEMLRGDLGQPPGGWPPALQEKALNGVAPINVRPGSLLPPADIEAIRLDAQKRCGRPIDDDELASFLMYPKVFADFDATVRKYGPMSALPTPVFFYGMKIGDEIAAEIERGKALVIQLQAIGETDDGQVPVFFELNGQPRVVKVPNRAVAGSAVSNRKAEDGNDAQIGAPMPGIVSTIAVKTGDAVKAGDILLTIEAMKMETSLRAPQDGIVEEMLAKVGRAVDAKDLLVTLATGVKI